MTNTKKVKEGVKIIKFCNKRSDMRKRKRRPGGNIRDSEMEKILSTQNLQESESVSDSSDYDDPDMRSNPDAGASELGDCFTTYGMGTQPTPAFVRTALHSYLSPFDQSATLPYGPSSLSTTLSQHPRSITASHRNNSQPPRIENNSHNMLPYIHGDPDWQSNPIYR